MTVQDSSDAACHGSGHAAATFTIKLPQERSLGRLIKIPLSLLALIERLLQLLLDGFLLSLAILDLLLFDGSTRSGAANGFKAATSQCRRAEYKQQSSTCSVVTHPNIIG